MRFNDVNFFQKMNKIKNEKMTLVDMILKNFFSIFSNWNTFFYFKKGKSFYDWILVKNKNESILGYKDICTASW